MIQIKELTCYDFRNHKYKKLHFKENVIIFWGNNGQGKTNLLEALSVISSGKSWRETSGVDLIKNNQNSAKIEVTFNNDSYTTLIEPRKRQFFKNEKKISLKSHLGNIPTLLFCPEHLNLFRGTKSNRLKFFDRFLKQIFPRYNKYLLRANKAHKQKTACLKMHKDQPGMLKSLILPWNKILSETIPQIIKTRNIFLKKLSPILQSELFNISKKKDTINIEFQQSQDFIPSTEGVLSFFEKDFPRELITCRNFITPNSGDIVFSLRSQNITKTASRGEERSVLLSLLSAKKKYLKDKHNIIPILLLDDVFSELDDNRQKHLQLICQDTQVFFTTTHKEHFRNFDKKAQSIEIKNDL